MQAEDERLSFPIYFILSFPIYFILPYLFYCVPSRDPGFNSGFWPENSPSLMLVNS